MHNSGTEVGPGTSAEERVNERRRTLFGKTGRILIGIVATGGLLFSVHATAMSKEATGEAPVHEVVQEPSVSSAADLAPEAPADAWADNSQVVPDQAPMIEKPESKKGSKAGAQQDSRSGKHDGDKRGDQRGDQPNDDPGSNPGADDGEQRGDNRNYSREIDPAPSDEGSDAKTDTLFDGSNPVPSDPSQAKLPLR